LGIKDFSCGFGNYGLFHAVSIYIIVSVTWTAAPVVNSTMPFYYA